jgi:hypothetical protein
LSRKSSLTPVWNVWIASTASSYRCSTRRFAAASRPSVATSSLFLRPSARFAAACTAIVVAVPPTTARTTAADSAAIAGLRRHHSHARSADPTRRAAIGRPSNQARRSSASARAVA